MRKKFRLYQAVGIFVILHVIAMVHCHASITHIYGHWKDGPKTIYLSYWMISSGLGENYVRASVDPASGAFEFHIEMKYPAYVQLQNQRIIAIPGDTVKLDIANTQGGSTFEFSDRRHGRNFLEDVTRAFKPFPFDKHTFTNHAALMKFKQAIGHRYDSMVVFLEEYFKSGDAVIASVARNYLNIRYNEYLLYPLANISAQELPSGYLSDLDPEFFENESLLGFREFTLLLSYYHRYIKMPAGSKYIGYDSATIAAITKSLFSGSIKGRSRDYLTLFTFNHVAEYGSLKNASQMDQMYKNLTSSFADDLTITASIQKSNDLFRKLGSSLPHEILAQELKTVNGSTIRLQNLLSSNKVVYMDVWASWCGPCIAEMEAEKKLIAELKGADVKFVLISIDEDEQKWKSSVAKINISGEHYLVPKGVESDMIKYFSFREIPRYLIFSRDGRLVSRAAPRPGKVLNDKSILLK